MSKKIIGTITLQKGRERSLLNRHPWVFSGAVAQADGVTPGALVRVCAHDGSYLATGYANLENSLAIRLFSFANIDPFDALRANVRRAIAMRRVLFNERITDAVRLINGESDLLPGLIVDQYADVLVIQIGTRGMEMLREFIVEELSQQCSPRCIYEKSNLPSRKEEGLDPAECVRAGVLPERVKIRENKLLFEVTLQDSQKTGFFLDQRENRALIGSLSQGKDVLNLFSYTGGFSVYAGVFGARKVVSVDISADAIVGARRNLELNMISADRAPCVEADVFEYLRSSKESFDLVVLDPPAFAKKKGNVGQAAKGYHEINRQALKLVRPGGCLLTCSCSYHVDAELFQKIIFNAARELGRDVRIVQRHRMAFDHGVSVFHPEGDYLKSLLLQVGE